jgi:hypothetical protein
MPNKKCSKCKEIKDTTEFSKNRTCKDGFHPHCKVCVHVYQTANIDAISVKRRAYLKANAEKIRARQAAWCEKNKDKIRARQAAYRKEHSDKIRNLWEVYRTQIRAKYGVSCTTLRYRADPQARLRAILRSRLRTALNRKFKTGSAVRDLGCTIPELLDRLDKQCMERYGETYTGAPPGKYHIDHIRPLASFNLQDPGQLKQAVHHSNLQVLLASENLQKGAGFSDNEAYEEVP